MMMMIMMMNFLLQLGFHPVTVVGKLIQKQERDGYVQKEKNTKLIQKPNINNIENKHKKQENKHKIIIKNVSQVIRKYRREANNRTSYCTEPIYRYLNINQ